MKRKKLKISLLVFFILLLCVNFFIFTEIKIMTYLNEYGYGEDKLLQTTLVYFHLSNGFTVEENEEYSDFIGRHSDIYEDVVAKKGYYEADRMGNTAFYNKKGETKTNERTFDFSIFSTGDWCHWFRVYSITDGYKIEDF